MKSRLLFLFILLYSVTFGQIFQQDFSSSSTVSDYINPSPANSFFNSISSSGAGVTVTVNSNRLRFVRAGANTGSFTRNTDMSGPPTSLIYQFDLSISGSTTPATSVALFYVGNNFSTTNTTEANADVFARFSVNTTATDGNFQLRDITSGTNSITLSGTVRVWWVMNNSGAMLEYKAPNGSMATIGTGKADLWGGSTILFNDAAVQTPAQAIADIKFVNNQGSQTIDIDNILIDPVPPVTTSNSATSVAAHSFTANWTPVAGVTGYRLDVSKVNDFSTYVSGYENLYIAGSGTSSAAVTGLLWGNTYYYRVRSAASYSAGELESGNSNVTFVVTGILPVTFTAISARQCEEIIEIDFNVESETGVHRYELQRSIEGQVFVPVAELPALNDGANAEYTIADPMPCADGALYRVAAFSGNGESQYSKVITARYTGYKRPALRLKANPVSGSTLSFSPENIPDGKYFVLIIKTTGEILLRREMIFRKGLMTTIPLHRFEAGSYILLVKGVIRLSEVFVIGR